MESWCRNKASLSKDTRVELIVHCGRFQHWRRRARGLALESDLVDECHLFLNPVIVGGGKRAFRAAS
jgi:riboflavin biosynthesis pyrimidine reductase